MGALVHSFSERVDEDTLAAMRVAEAADREQEEQELKVPACAHTPAQTCTLWTALLAAGGGNGARARGVVRAPVDGES